MRFCIALSFFCLCLSGLVHAAEKSAPDQSLAQAHVVYKEQYSASPSGVYENGDVLFVIAELAKEEQSTERTARMRLQQSRGRAMLASNKLLRAYIIEKFPPPENPPPKPFLIETFPKLLPLLRAAEPKMGVFSWQETWQYNGPARILQNESVGDIYRYVVAIPSTGLENTIPDVQRDGPDDPTVERALQTAWSSLAKDGKLSMMYDALDLPEDRLHLANDELRRRVNADSLCWGVFSPRKLQIAERRIATLNARPALGTLKEISKDAPVSARGLADWADSGDAPLWNALNARLLTLDDEEIRAISLGHISKPGESPTEKYAVCLSALAAHPWPELLHDAKPGPVVTVAWRTLGHANFPDAAPDTETPEYREAKELYDAGRELPRLVGLLACSLETSPRHAASWALLGNALRANDTPQDAVWPLVQALRLSPNDTNTRASLALAYQESDRPEWAVGMAASVLAIPDASEWSRKKAKEILENLKPKGETP